MNIIAHSEQQQQCINPEYNSDCQCNKCADYSDVHLQLTKNGQKSSISTQVNMDEQFSKVEGNKQKKKEKKRQYKKRKRERERDQERQTRNLLAEIINRIYRGETNFNKSKVDIDKCLQRMITGEKFHTFLNQAIRLHVNNIQKQVWAFMQDIIHENPFQKSNEDQQFYLLMIDRIYSEFRKLQKSSRQIQKIINTYMFLKSNKQQDQNYDLDRSTFNYFIESDQTIKNLIRICERRISIQHEKQVLKLKEICEMMNADDDEQQYYYDDSLDQDFTERSTSVDQEQFEEKISKKKKKKRKIDYSSQFYDVIKRINDMTIFREDRITCEVTQEWVEGLKYRINLEE